MWRIWCERPLPEQYRHLAGDAELAWRGPGEDGMEALLRSMAGAQATIASAYVRYDGQLFDQLPALQVVSRTGIGVDGVALDEATGADQIVRSWLDLRSELRTSRQFDLADRIRDGLASLGVTIEDKAGGTDWRRTGR